MLTSYSTPWQCTQPTPFSQHTTRQKFVSVLTSHVMSLSPDCPLLHDWNSHFLPVCAEPPLTFAGLSLPLWSVTRILTFCLCVLTSLPGDFFFFPFSSWLPLPAVCGTASHSCRPVLAIAVSDPSSRFLSLYADVPSRGFFFFPFSSRSPLPTVCRTASHSCRPVLAVAVSDPSSHFLSLCADVPPRGFFFFSLSAPGCPVPTLSPSALSRSSLYSLALFLTVASSSNFAVCTATPSLNVSSLTCQIWTIAAAPVPIAPFLSVGDPYFLQLCQYFVAAFW